MKMYRLTLLLLAFAGLLSACSGGEDFREPKSEEDLSGLVLAASNGSYYQQKYEKRTDVQLFLVANEADGVQAVRQGHADVYVSDEVMLTKADMKRLGMKKAFVGDECFDVAFAIRKGNTEIAEQLNAFLASAPLEDITNYWINGGPYVEEPAYTIPEGAKPLRFVCAVNIAPISYVGEGGKWQGLDVDILQRFAHSVGRPFEMQFMDVGSAIMAINTGKADVFSGCLFITEERQKSMDFSTPYYKCHPGYFIVDHSRDARMGLGERIHMNLIKENRIKLIWDGLVETIKITFFAILLGTILGIGVCACRRSKRRWVRGLADLYGDFINGIPTLVLLLILFYVVFANSGMSATLVAIIAFAMCFASSAGNIFDTSISAVPKGQTEAGLSLGFTPFKTFMGIVFPQALRKGLPLYTGECISLLKNTSIVGYIAIADLTRASDLIRSRTFDALIPLLVITIIYFILAWLIRKTLNLCLLRK